MYIDIQTLSHVFIKFLSLHEMDALTRGIKIKSYKDPNRSRLDAILTLVC